MTHPFLCLSIRWHDSVHFIKINHDPKDIKKAQIYPVVLDALCYTRGACVFTLLLYISRILGFYAII